MQMNFLIVVLAFTRASTHTHTLAIEIALCGVLCISTHNIQHIYTMCIQTISIHLIYLTNWWSFNAVSYSLACHIRLPLALMFSSSSSSTLLCNLRAFPTIFFFIFTIDISLSSLILFLPRYNRAAAMCFLRNYSTRVKFAVTFTTFRRYFLYAQ